MAKTAAWQRQEGKDPKGGLNRKGVASYRRANPGSKLKLAVTTKPSKLKPGSKAAKRRKSYCASSAGQLNRSSAKSRNDPISRNLAFQMTQSISMATSLSVVTGHPNCVGGI